MAHAGGTPRIIRGLLDPAESVVLLVDHQPMTLFGLRSHDPQTVVSNVTALAKAAKAFDVPVVLSSIAAQGGDGIGGLLIPEVRAVFPDQEIIDRSSINAWEDDRFRDAVLATGRRQIIIAGLWTEMCVAFPTISALEEGREVYVVADASGGASVEAHQLSLDRLVAKGAVPVTTGVVLGEFQRDWARLDTYSAVTGIVREHFGNWGQAITYYGDVTAAHDAKNDTSAASK